MSTYTQHYAFKNINRHMFMPTPLLSNDHNTTDEKSSRTRVLQSGGVDRTQSYSGSSSGKAVTLE